MFNTKIEQIRLYQIPVNLDSSISYLEGLSEQITLLALYQKIFPDEWSESIIPFNSYSNKSAYTDKELEFLNLVNDNLFPVDFLEYDDTERHDEIPIYPKYFDMWEENIDDLELAEQFLISLLGQGYDPEEWEDRFGFTPSYVVQLENIDQDKLENLFSHQEEPLCYFCDTLWMLDKSTENIWIDASTYTNDSLEWSYENILFLAEQWQNATLYLSNCSQLCEWIDEIDNRQKVVELWNQSKKKSTNTQSKIC
ncbi:hypothetical protein WA1_49060 [Scytonema hofmannii PCC 7110]|uniref:Uncharacterized protein n=1 Tax=Scytonema hofmannii PCC 7110 TaxID=128403 RepID=A0A139WQJ0_9CYAN|nr:hypothetical protein [Scytonema hofmannii]KYC34692.1 hypothetical protein WA1_49060 [Scytonema hofmannii PCC 7110]